MAVVSMMSSNGTAWTEVGRTEVVSNSHHPSFVKQIRVLYSFEELQPVRIQIFDVDTRFDHKNTKELELSRQDFLGEAQFLLSEVTVRAEEIANTNALITLTMRGQNLDKKDTFGKSDPYLRVWRTREDGSRLTVYKTEVKHNTLAPVWAPVQITLQQLCNADPDRPLILEVLDWDRAGRHDLIGEAQASFNDMKQLAASGGAISLYHPAKKAAAGPNSVSSSGQLFVAACTLTPRHSFLDYIMGGCELSFMVAIDFTASNGDPRDPTSLHFAGGSTPNVYQKAIRAVGDVVAFYDTDKQFSAWGFGARQAPNPVSHCFALNGSAYNPEVNGVDGILSAYSQALRVMTLSGPTLFAPLVSTAASIASAFVSQERQKYFVLLIITDGEILDMDNTVNALIEASGLPLSVLIVGVGNSEFTNMEVLDGDKHLLSIGGRTAARDIVQFVAFNKYMSTNFDDATQTSVMLASDLLAELPGQFLSYMQSRGIVPNKPAAPMKANPTAPPPPSQQQHQHQGRDGVHAPPPASGSSPGPNTPSDMTYAQTYTQPPPYRV
eukprot:jgi/Chlat1/5492/Chrsp36S05464